SAAPTQTIACLPLLTTTMLRPSAFLRRMPPISILKPRGPRRFSPPCSGAASQPPPELLKQGADANYQDSKGMTALHCMLKKGVDKKYVRMFLDYGAKTDIKNKAGATAAAIMVRKRDPDFRRMLQP